MNITIPRKSDPYSAENLRRISDSVIPPDFQERIDRLYERVLLGMVNEAKKGNREYETPRYTHYWKVHESALESIAEKLRKKGFRAIAYSTKNSAYLKVSWE